MQRETERTGLMFTVVAVCMFSTSSVLIRWAAPLDPLTIAAVRTSIGSLTMIAVSLALKRTWQPPPRRDWLRYLLYGLIAAGHFALYVASLAYTTIAHSLSITYTAPIWVTLFARIILGEPFPRRKWPGVLISVIGIGVLTGFEPSLDRQMLVGDLLALGAAICFGLYSVVGRSQREKAPLLTYTAAVYGVAGLWMAVPGWLAYQPGSLTWTAGLAVLGGSILPLGIGHTLYNAALRRLHPTVVSVLATQEVVGGVLLGVVLLGEVPGPSAAVGSLIVLGGVIWTLLR